MVDVNSFRFNCCYSGEGCDYEDSNRGLKEHEENCIFRKIKCPDSDCEDVLKFLDLRDHLETAHEATLYVTSNM